MRAMPAGRGQNLNRKRRGSRDELTRGEQISLIMRLSVMVILAWALVRALMAFRHLQRGHDIPFQYTFYIPIALFAGLALTLFSIWRALREVYAGSRYREPSEHEEKP